MKYNSLDGEWQDTHIRLWQRCIFYPLNMRKTFEHIYGGGDYNHQVAVQNKWRDTKMHFIVRDSGLSPSVLCRKSPILVSEKTNIVECGIFIYRNLNSNTVNINLKFLNEWVTPVSSVTSKVFIFVGASVLIAWILYFVPPICKEKISEALL